MKRQQITDRNIYDFDDRIYIAEKSNYLCAHCGTPLHLVDNNVKNATVDHYIPLSKGGINQKLNTIMLCKDCNKKKQNKIIAPENYIRYLKPQYMKEIRDYYDSYIHSFEYIGRENLMCCDEYVLDIYCGPDISTIQPKKRDAITKQMTKYFTIQRAHKDDIPYLENFYIAYLKKYGYLHSVDTACKNIEFWKTFGAIYYITDKDGEIKAMVPITIGSDDLGAHNINIFIFSKYSTLLGKRLTFEIQWFVASTIMEEQGLRQLRLASRVLAKDPNVKFLYKAVYEGLDIDCYIARTVYHREDMEGLRDKYIDDTAEFFRMFEDIEIKMDRFFSRRGYKKIRYMGNEIIPGYGFKHITKSDKGSPCDDKAQNDVKEALQVG